MGCMSYSMCRVRMCRAVRECRGGVFFRWPCHRTRAGRCPVRERAPAGREHDTAHTPHRAPTPLKFPGLSSNRTASGVSELLGLGPPRLTILMRVGRRGVPQSPRPVDSVHGAAEGGVGDPQVREDVAPVGGLVLVHVSSSMSPRPCRSSSGRRTRRGAERCRRACSGRSRRSCRLWGRCGTGGAAAGGRRPPSLPRLRAASGPFLVVLRTTSRCRSSDRARAKARSRIRERSVCSPAQADEHHGGSALRSSNVNS